jgi:molybdopterin converting factor small subunit
VADKKTHLSIVIRTVDKATAAIRAIHERITRMTAPIRALGARMVDSFKGVGSALSGVTSAIGGLLSKIPLVGGIIVGTAGAAVAGLMSLVDGYDELGDKAEEAGVSVDFLAQLRYAAEKSGASVEQLDGGLKGFVTSLGQAKAGSGRMAAFLNQVSPALLKQLKAAKNNEEAFGLLAAAMEKIKDPAKRAALAQKTLGDASLAPLLARGAKGIEELRARYAELAGSQEEAVEKSGEVDDAMKDLRASTDGIKAALVTGLAPALKVIVERLRNWFVKHRGDIAQWAADLGEKLPGAIRSVVAWVERAVGRLKSFFEVMAKIYNKVDAFIHLERTQQENAERKRRVEFYKKANTDKSLTAEELEAGALLKVTQEDELRERIKAQAAGINWVEANDSARFGTANRTTMYSPEELRALVGTIGMGSGSKGIENLELITQAITAAGGARGDVSGQTRGAMARLRDQKAKIEIDIKGAPAGTRASVDPQSTADVDLSTGYQLNPGAL